MTKVELIAAVAEKANLTKKDAEAAVNGALDVITESLKGGDKVTLVGYAVKVGDVIEITFGNRPVKVRVLAVEEPKGKDVARELFEVIE